VLAATDLPERDGGRPKLILTVRKNHFIGHLSSRKAEILENFLTE
jgi:hypothetical protein